MNNRKSPRPFHNSRMCLMLVSLALLPIPILLQATDTSVIGAKTPPALPVPPEQELLAQEFSSGLAQGKVLLDDGDLLGAEAKFRSVVEDASKAGQEFEEAIARKWLALSLARLGQNRGTEAEREIALSKAMLETLAARGNKEAQTQLGFVLFDTADIRRSSAETLLRNQLLSGLTKESYYQIINSYVAPAEKALDDAAKFYPQEELADLDMARAELSLLLARLSATFMPLGSSVASYKKAIEQFRSCI